MENNYGEEKELKHTVNEVNKFILERRVKRLRITMIVLTSAFIITIPVGIIMGIVESCSLVTVGIIGFFGLPILAIIIILLIFWGIARNKIKKEP